MMKYELLYKHKVMELLSDMAMQALQTNDHPRYKQLRHDTFQEARLIVGDMSADNEWISFDKQFPKKGTHICVIKRDSSNLYGNCACALYGTDGKLYLYDNTCGFSNIRECYSHWFYMPEIPPREN